jgi:hypothetical protein
MAKPWHRAPREGTTTYVRMNVWLMRRPWALALFVLLELWALTRRVSIWRVLMLLSSVLWFIGSIVNNATQGRVERAIWPGIWAQ